MKKLAIITLVFGALFLGSCMKEDIRPNATEQDAPEWKKSRAGEATTTGTSGTTEGDTGSGITDPNNDEDSNGRKKN